MNNYPKCWLQVYKAPLVDIYRFLTWAPKDVKAMPWPVMCEKLMSWYFANEKTLQKAAKTKFAHLFWAKYCEELHPKAGSKPETILRKMYRVPVCFVNHILMGTPCALAAKMICPSGGLQPL